MSSSIPVPGLASKSTSLSSIGLLFAIGGVFCLAIMYLFTRIRKQDAVLDKMKKELQQQIQDQDIIQLTRGYLQSDDFKQVLYPYVQCVIHDQFPVLLKQLPQFQMPPVQPPPPLQDSCTVGEICEYVPSERQYNEPEKTDSDISTDVDVEESTLLTVDKKEEKEETKDNGVNFVNEGEIIEPVATFDKKEEDVVANAEKEEEPLKDSTETQQLPLVTKKHKRKKKSV